MSKVIETTSGHCRGFLPWADDVGVVRRRAIAIGLVAVLVLITGAGLAIRSFEDQVNNSILVQLLASRVRNERAAHGAYPKSINERDFWGRELLYIANGTGFVLVSFGRDGRPDRADYARLIGYKPSSVSNTCLSPSSDTVFTDQGPVSCCLK